MDDQGLDRASAPLKIPPRDFFPHPPFYLCHQHMKHNFLHSDFLRLEDLLVHFSICNSRLPCSVKARLTLAAPKRCVFLPVRNSDRVSSFVIGLAHSVSTQNVIYSASRIVSHAFPWLFQSQADQGTPLVKVVCSPTIICSVFTCQRHQSSFMERMSRQHFQLLRPCHRI